MNNQVFVKAFNIFLRNVQLEVPKVILPENFGDKEVSSMEDTGINPVGEKVLVLESLIL